MFIKFHKMREDRDERGFTLIELLVVILIIAILAAIAIPAFLNQREKSWVSQQQSALKNAATAAESYATGNNGSYTGLTPTVLADNGYNENAAGAVTVTVAAAPVPGTTYCLIATHDTLTNAAPATDWGVASYDPGEGEPSPADAC